MVFKMETHLGMFSLSIPLFGKGAEAPLGSGICLKSYHKEIFGWKTSSSFLAMVVAPTKSSKRERLLMPWKRPARRNELALERMKKKQMKNIYSLTSRKLSYTVLELKPALLMLSPFLGLCMCSRYYTLVDSFVVLSEML